MPHTYIFNSATCKFRKTVFFLQAQALLFLEWLPSAYGPQNCKESQKRSNFYFSLFGVIFPPIYCSSLSLLRFLFIFFNGRGCIFFSLQKKKKNGFWMLAQLSDHSLSVVWWTLHDSIKCSEVFSRTEGIDVYSSEDIH